MRGKQDIRIGLKAGIVAARSAIAGAREEIQMRSLPYQERIAVRGAALRAIDQIYYSALTTKAVDQLISMAKKKEGSWMGALKGRDMLLDLAGWEDVP